MARIGFVGLGTMGGPMAGHLVAAGHEVLGADTSPEARDAARAAGVTVVEDATACAEGVDVLVTMLTTGQVVRAVLLEGPALLERVAPGTLVVDCSSIDVATTAELGEVAARRGVDLVDAPVSGGVVGARAGTLTFMVGATDGPLARAEPVLAAMGRRVVHVGGPGAGQATKICNQMLFGSTLVAVAEAFTLASHLGLDPRRFHDVVTQATGDCWAVRNFCPWPGVVEGSAADEGYAARFAARLMSKDVHLATAAAADVGQELPLAERAAALYAALAEHDGDLDASAVIRELPAPTGR